MEDLEVSKKLEDNIRKISGILPVQESFDIIQRTMEIGGRKGTFYFIDGFTKDESMLKIMD